MLPERYNKCDIEGWRVYDEGELKPPDDPDDETYTEKLDRIAFEAQMLCPKQEK